MKLIDLSHPISNDMPTYPSDPKVYINQQKNINKNRSLLHQFTMGTHTGTHLDVPSHILAKGKTLSDFSLDSFMAIRAIKVNKKNFIEIKDIKDRIDMVIYDTSWYKKIRNPLVFFGKERPLIPLELIEICLKVKINIFGCDLPSVDKSGCKEKKIHNSLLSKNIIIYESLNNLNQVPFLEFFEFYGFPLSFLKLDGSPVRAVGVVK